MGKRSLLLLLVWLALSGTGLAVVLAGLRGSRTDALRGRRAEARQDVDDALQRVFGDALAADAIGGFVVADLNGDGVDDLAVSVRPRPERLAALNAPLVNWTIQDAGQPSAPDAAVKGRRPVLEAADRLLAVIHGAGRRAWRDAEARQAYLVRNAAVPPCPVRRAGELAGLVPPGTGLPRPVGDILLEGEPAATTRFFYWNGGRYLWFTLPPAAPGVSASPSQ